VRRWRRCLTTTAAIEIAARTATAIRTGTSGEEELSSAVVELTGWPLPIEPAC
jgi:hypothetical protein